MVESVQAASSERRENLIDKTVRQNRRRIHRNYRRMRAQAQARKIALEIRMAQFKETTEKIQNGERLDFSNNSGLMTQLGWVLDRFV
ncbi:hypothetical protein KQI52_16210 [bacterium]|nr:hypothetical protein [bacterium]